ncbi:MAG: histidine phosphatase family protein [Clostridia bacterium]|jgi:broad specificity phosphatase PhoE
MDLILVRHGESLGNIVDYDCPDPELTERGVKQAHLLAERLADEKLDYIFSSPLVRALETAWIVASYQDNKPEVRIDLREVRGLGKHIGLSGKTLMKRYPGIRLLDKAFESHQGWEDPGNESREMGFLRASSVVEYLKRRFTGDERILIVAHGGFNSLFIASLLGLSHWDAVRFAQHNTCLNRFKIEHNQCRVECINDASHLRPL